VRVPHRSKKFMSLVDYDDSPAPGEAAAEPVTEAAEATLAAAAAPSARLLSIVDYDVEPNEAAPLPARNLGISLDDDEIVKSGARRVGSTTTSFSVVKRPTKLPETATAPTDGPDAGSTAGPSSSADVPADDGEPTRPAFVVPDSPPGECNPRVMEKYLGFVQSSQEGNCVNDYIRHSKRFRNPDLLEKLVAYMDVVENGSNYPTDLYDPTAFGPEEYYDQLEKTRRQYEERQSRKPGERVQFQSSGQLEPPKPAASAAPAAASSAASSAATTSSTAALAAAADAASSKRKSRWGSSEDDAAKVARN